MMNYFQSHIIRVHIPIGLAVGSVVVSDTIDISVVEGEGGMKIVERGHFN